MDTETEIKFYDFDDSISKLNSYINTFKTNIQATKRRCKTIKNNVENLNEFNDQLKKYGRIYNEKDSEGNVIAVYKEAWKFNIDASLQNDNESLISSCDEILEFLEQISKKIKEAEKSYENAWRENQKLEKQLTPEEFEIIRYSMYKDEYQAARNSDDKMKISDDYVQYWTDEPLTYTYDTKTGAYLITQGGVGMGWISKETYDKLYNYYENKIILQEVNGSGIYTEYSNKNYILKNALNNTIKGNKNTGDYTITDKDGKIIEYGNNNNGFYVKNNYQDNTITVGNRKTGAYNILDENTKEIIKKGNKITGVYTKRDKNDDSVTFDTKTGEYSINDNNGELKSSMTVEDDAITITEKESDATSTVTIDIKTGEVEHKKNSSNDYTYIADKEKISLTDETGETIAYKDQATNETVIVDEESVENWKDEYKQEQVNKITETMPNYDKYTSKKEETGNEKFDFEQFNADFFPNLNNDDIQEVKTRESLNSNLNNMFNFQYDMLDNSLLNSQQNK